MDFKPEAVLLLVDRMRKNPKVAAACGRIHPTGDGRKSIILFKISKKKISFRTYCLVSTI